MSFIWNKSLSYICHNSIMWNRLCKWCFFNVCYIMFCFVLRFCPLLFRDQTLSLQGLTVVKCICLIQFIIVIQEFVHCTCAWNRYVWNQQHLVSHIPTVMSDHMAKRDLDLQLFRHFHLMLVLQTTESK